MSRNENNSGKKKGKKKKSIGFKILMGFLAVILAIIVAGGGYIYGLINKMDKVDLDKKDLGIVEEHFDEYSNSDKIKSIALFGVDAEDGGAGRSDSIMIATIDPVHNKLKVTSIMRDSYVDIPGYGMDKINHAYAFGGPQLSIKTINENFGLNIEDFVAVDFSTLPTIIDTLGGLGIEVTDEEVALINSYVTSSYLPSSGYQYLDGDQALYYSRIRSTAGGDFERTLRQRTVLNSLFSTLLNTPASSYNSVLNNILPYVQTNLSATTILDLGTKVLGVGNGVLEQERFPRDGYSEGATIDGVYYLKFDIESTITQMRDYIFNDK